MLWRRLYAFPPSTNSGHRCTRSGCRCAKLILKQGAFDKANLSLITVFPLLVVTERGELGLESENVIWTCALPPSGQ